MDDRPARVNADVLPPDHISVRVVLPHLAQRNPRPDVTPFKRPLQHHHIVRLLHHAVVYRHRLEPAVHL